MSGQVAFRAEHSRRTCSPAGGRGNPAWRDAPAKDARPGPGPALVHQPVGAGSRGAGAPSLFKRGGACESADPMRSWFAIERDRSSLV